MLIGTKEIGPTKPTYFIAEIGANFDSDIERAKDLIWLAKNCNADAVKFQHYTAATLVSDFGFKNLTNQTHQSSWKKSVFETYKQAALNAEWTATLAEEATKAEIEFFTSPYAHHLVDWVDPYVSVFKIGSGDITWIDYLEYVASKKKPLILATGASTADEVDTAVTAILKKNKDLILMQCNTNYTGQENNLKFLNLRVLETYAKQYPNLILGLSDHSTSHASVLGAISFGARVIERHFTDDTKRDGPDHPFSTNPNSWREMIKLARELEEMLGDGIKRVEENEEGSRIVQRRGICAKNDFQSDHIISEKSLDFLRPCSQHALPPNKAKLLIGKRLRRNIRKGEAINISDVTG